MYITTYCGDKKNTIPLKDCLRFNELIDIKDGKIVKRASTLQYYNGHYWSDVQSKTETRTWDNEGKYWKYDRSAAD